MHSLECTGDRKDASVFGPDPVSDTLSKQLLRLRCFRIAFAMMSLSATSPATSAVAQQVNPFAVKQPFAARLPRVDIPQTLPHQDLQYKDQIQASAETTLLTPVVANAQPSRLPPAELPKRSAAPVVVPVIPVSTSESRFEPIQVNTPNWLPAVTPVSKQLDGRRWLAQAHHEYAVSAFASAETSAWSALRHFAEAIDEPVLQITPQAGVSVPLTATQCLAIAETALEEAKDFAGKYGAVDTEAIKRFVRCHQTKVLRLDDQEDMAPISSSEAVDRYMNEARVHLSPIAAASVDAAEAMDLLAEIALSRYDADALPNEVSLTLWRAVVQGQPSNDMVASTLGKHLARVGLYEEARWAFEHSLSMAFDEQTAMAMAETSHKLGDTETASQLNDQIAQQQRNSDFANRPRVPDVIQLTPEQFAALSQPIMLQNSTVERESTARPNQFEKSHRVSATLASTKLPLTENNTTVESDSNETDVIEPVGSSQPSLLKGIIKRIGGSK